MEMLLLLVAGALVGWAVKYMWDQVEERRERQSRSYDKMFQQAWEEFALIRDRMDKAQRSRDSDFTMITDNLTRIQEQNTKRFAAMEDRMNRVASDVQFVKGRRAEDVEGVRMDLTRKLVHVMERMNEIYTPPVFGSECEEDCDEYEPELINPANGILVKLADKVDAFKVDLRLEFGKRTLNIEQEIRDMKAAGQPMKSEMDNRLTFLEKSVAGLQRATSPAVGDGNESAG